MKTYLRLMLCLSCLPLVACGSSASPTAPTSNAATLSSPAFAGSVQPIGSSRLGALNDGHRKGHVEGESVVSSLVPSTSCPTLSFIIAGETVRTTTSTVYTGGTCADIKPGVHLGVKGDFEIDDTVIASTIVFKRDDDDDHDGKFVEGNAVVTSLVTGTSCPALSFVADGFTIKTSTATHFSSGTCADIVPGRPLTIQGMMLANGTVNATHIVLKGDHPTDVEGDVVIASLVAGTTCPALGFTVSGHTVRTNTATVFEHGTCADLKVGVRIQVKGLMQTDGSVTATRIKLKTEDDGDEDGEHHDD